MILSQFSDSDIIVAADGINSAIREQFANDFGTKTKNEKQPFCMDGIYTPVGRFYLFFQELHPYGTFVAHTYQYEEGMSTWIFETTDETWKKAGFDNTR